MVGKKNPSIDIMEIPNTSIPDDIGVNRYGGVEEERKINFERVERGREYIYYMHLCIYKYSKKISIKGGEEDMSLCHNMVSCDIFMKIRSNIKSTLNSTKLSSTTLIPLGLGLCQQHIHK